MIMEEADGENKTTPRKSDQVYPSLCAASGGEESKIVVVEHL